VSCLSPHDWQSSRWREPTLPRVKSNHIYQSPFLQFLSESLCVISTCKLNEPRPIPQAYQHNIHNINSKWTENKN
jgi:hypothetical protein